MRNKKYFSRYNVPKYLFYSFILLCWCIALMETAFHQIETNKTVPAFQNETSSSSDAVPAFQNETSFSSDAVPAFQNETSFSSNAVPAFQNETSFSSDAVPTFQSKTISLSDAVPTFQTTSSQTLEVSSIPQNLTRQSVSTFSRQLAQQIDSGTILISSHSDSKYSDFYYYSPTLKEQFQLDPISSDGSNLQIVITWKEDGSCGHIYLGMPCIEYSF